MPRIIHPDPFAPVLLKSRSLAVSEEQSDYLKQILDRACSDSRFAQKAFVAITGVLTAGSVVPPVINTLSPNTLEIGDPDATLHVFGSGFLASSVIVFAGVEEPTTFVSPTELTTGINMSVWLGPAVLPVTVRNGSVESDPVNFTFTDNVPAALSSNQFTPKLAPVNPPFQKPVESVSDKPVVSPDPVIELPPTDHPDQKEIEVRKPALKTQEEPKDDQVKDKMEQEGRK